MKDPTRFTPDGKLTRTYRRWSSMLQRCENPRCACFSYYGGRGITVCKRWHNFDLFYKDMGEAPAGKWLERKNNKRGYQPGNCIWATPKEQAQNRRPRSPNPNSIRQQAIRAHLDPKVVHYRLRAGWTLNAALATPKLAPGERNENCYA